MYQIIDGKKISQEIKDELREKVAAYKAEGKNVTLAVIQVGNDPASSIYVRNKKRACEYIGIRSLSYELDEQISEDELLSLIDTLNADDAVNGILVQLPHLKKTQIVFIQKMQANFVLANQDFYQQLLQALQNY